MIKKNTPVREIVLDTETTGLDPKKGHRLIAIACVELVNHRPTGRVYQQFLNPGFPMSDEVVVIHGISNKFLVNKPSFSEIVDGFLDFIGSDPIIIHNAPFDLKFLKSELRKCHRKILNNEIIDTVPIARQKFPGRRISLNELCKRFHINPIKFFDSGPLSDARALAEVYRLMCYPTLWEKTTHLCQVMTMSFFDVFRV